MLCNRIKQFREYNNLDSKLLAKMLGISEKEYKAFESGKENPDIDIITRLATYYKVTIEEFYGYTPRLQLHSKEAEFDLGDDDDVGERILKMSDLSWDEAQLILYYRAHKDENDEIIKKILEKE